MAKYLMKCGHTSNAHDQDGNPVCAICAGINPDGVIVDHEVVGCEGLEDREAQCDYCRKTVASNWSLPFFEHRPDKDYDSYYCGCRGWD